MKTEQKFIKAINDNPQDRTTQLVYAHWLEEQGDDRAEAWRLMVQEDKFPNGCPEYYWWAWYRPKEEEFTQIPINSCLVGCLRLDGPEEGLGEVGSIASRLRHDRKETFFEAMNAAAEAYVEYNSLPTCPCCNKKSSTIRRRHRNTAYVDDKLNWIDSCKQCYEEDCEYFQELWDEYNGSRL